MRPVPVVTASGDLAAITVVDDADYERVMEHRWYLHTNGYAKRREGPASTIFLHREITDAPPGRIDHINRCRLDNQRHNLRAVTQAENNQNLSARSGGTSRHRGVSWNSHRRCWVARVTADGRLFQKYCQTETEAARWATDMRLAHLPFSEEIV